MHVSIKLYFLMKNLIKDEERRCWSQESQILLLIVSGLGNKLEIYQVKGVTSSNKQHPENKIRAAYWSTVFFHKD